MEQVNLTAVGDENEHDLSALLAEIELDNLFERTKKLSGKRDFFGIVCLWTTVSQTTRDAIYDACIEYDPTISNAELKTARAQLWEHFESEVYNKIFKKAQAKRASKGGGIHDSHQTRNRPHKRDYRHISETHARPKRQSKRPERPHIRHVGHSGEEIPYRGRRR